MKLLLCMRCDDLLSLCPNGIGVWRHCYCGESAGRYITNEYAEYAGAGEIVGFGNMEFEIMKGIIKTGRPMGLDAINWGREHRATKVALPPIVTGEFDEVCDACRSNGPNAKGCTCRRSS